MIRLRQRSTFGKSLITGSVYYKPSKITTANYTLTGTSCGVDQAVRDQAPIPKQWNKKVSTARKWRAPRKWTDFQKRTQFTAPNAVAMTKVEKLAPKQSNDLKYKFENATYLVRFSGPNAARVIMSQSTSDPFYPPYATSFTSVNLDVASYLYQRALARASSAEFDFGVTVGEIAETAAFLASPLRSIATLSSKAFRGASMVFREGPKTCIEISKKASKRQVRRLMACTTAANPLHPAKRVLDETANHWLAYKFGVLPIFDDIAKGMEFREKNIQRLLGVRTAKVKSLKLDTTTSRLDRDLPWYYTRGDYYRTKRVEDRHTFGLYYQNRVTLPLANFLENLGFSYFTPFSLAWELIPLSFVVDRFIDIKSFIKGNLGGLSKDILCYYCSRKIETVYSLNITNFQYYSSGMRFPLTTTEELSAVAKSQFLARIVNLDRPKFPVINPYWRESLTADMTNLSLIWGRLQNFVGKSR